MVDGITMSKTWGEGNEHDSGFRARIDERKVMGWRCSEIVFEGSANTRTKLVWVVGGFPANFNDQTGRCVDVALCVDMKVLWGRICMRKDRRKTSKKPSQRSEQ